MRRVLVTGAAGYLGSRLVQSLAEGLGRSEFGCVVAADIREVDDAACLPGVDYLRWDVREPGLDSALRRFAVDTVVHLAAIVTPGPKSNRELEYAVDVEGTRNVLEACCAAGVRRIVVTSSGAAYGYHPDNPEWLSEDDPIRGNEEFAYSFHKRLVEDVGTILGATTRNQITALFERRRLLAIRGSASPFVFIWDEDVVGAIERAIDAGPPGVYNVAGDGAMSIQEIAAKLGKRCITLPAGLLRALLAVLHPLGLSRYGPEQVNFLRYRPVLANGRLKEVFGYVPRLSSSEVFELFCRTHGLGVGGS